ncbi:MAG: hypothetical protein ACREMC_02740 [Gemmatimonadales bacterium]
MIPMRGAVYVWRSLLFVPVVGALTAVTGLITGAPGNPALVDALTGLEWEQFRAELPGVAVLVSVVKRHESLALLGWAFWLAWANIQGTRSQSRWVWYGWWTVPVLTTGFMLTGAGVGGGMRPVLIAVTVLTVLGLVASRQVFATSEDRST